MTALQGLVEVRIANAWYPAIDLAFLPDWPDLRHIWFEHATHTPLIPTDPGVTPDSRYDDTWLPVDTMAALPLDYAASPDYTAFLRMCRVLTEAYGTQNVRVVFWRDEKVY